MSTEASTAENAIHHRIVVAAGALLIASPWILGYDGSYGATWNAAGIGAFIVVLGLFSLVNFAEWQDWFAGAAALWVAVAPWVAGFSDVAAAMTAHVVLGGVVFLLCIWRIRRLHMGGTPHHV